MKKRVTQKLMLMLTAASLLLAGCGGGTNSGATPSDASAGKESKMKIGIVQIVDHPSLNTIREAFLAELETLGVKADIDYQNASGDQNNLNSICQKFVGDKKDLIVAIATPSAQAAAGVTSEIPVLFSAVTDPVGAGLLTDPNKPGGNVTGTSDVIDVAKIFNLSAQLTPDAKKFGLLYDTGQANSVSVIEDVKKYAAENGITLVEAPITSTNEIQTAAQSLVGKVDAVFTPIDNTVASAMPLVVDVLKQAKIPYYVSADSMVADGGFATAGVNYTELGQKTARMAQRILNGEKPGDMPVEYLTDLKTYINRTTAEAIGISVPADVAAGAEMMD